MVNKMYFKTVKQTHGAAGLAECQCGRAEESILESDSAGN